MSTIKSSDEHLTLNADGTSKDIKFQANGVEKASISSAGAFTSTTIDATKLTGTIPNFTSTGIDDNATSTAITIDSSENVGFGVTPEPHHANWTGIDIGGMGNISGETAPASGRQFTLNNNAYLNTSENWVYKHSSDEAAQLQMFDGKFRFRTAPTGTADSNVTFTERLLITNDGRGLSQFTAKAWVNFQGSGTVNIKDSHNVSSISDNSTGNYSLSLANNLGNNHGVMSGYSIMDGLVYGDANNVSDAASFRFRTVVGSSNALFDSDEVHCIIFGD